MQKYAIYLFVFSVLLFVDSDLEAQQTIQQKDKKFQDKMNKKSPNGPDQAVGAWYINLGPTGLRVISRWAAPDVIEVKYVFPDSPAHGKVFVGDLIYGVNNKIFEVGFPTSLSNSGKEGTYREVGFAIEESQGDPKRQGILQLMIIREGAIRSSEKESSTKDGNSKSKKSYKSSKKSKKKDTESIVVTGKQRKISVDIKLRQLGYFGKTFPDDCEKSEKMANETLEYMYKNPQMFNHFMSSMAFLASGEKKYLPRVEQVVRKMMSREPTNKGRLSVWNWAFDAILLCEWYYATGDESVLPHLKKLYAIQLKGQFPSGNIYDAAAKGGVDKASGKPKKTYERNFPWKGTGGWGHDGWNGFAVGNGYGAFAPTTGPVFASWALMERAGMKIDKQAKYLAHDFLERCTMVNGYVQYKDNRRPGFPRSGNQMADLGRTGAAVMAHALFTSGGQVYLDYAKSGSACIGNNPSRALYTHTHNPLGLMWCFFGVSLTDDGDYHKLMQGLIWYYNLSRTHNGGFYTQPFGDSGDGGKPRNAMTPAMLFGLLKSRKKIQMLGAGLVPGIDIIKLSKMTKPIYNAVLDEKYGSAFKALRKYDENNEVGAVDRDLMKKIDTLLLQKVQMKVEEIKAHHEVKDLSTAYAIMLDTKKTFTGVNIYDTFTAKLLVLYKTEPYKKELYLGKLYDRMIVKVKEKPSRTNIKKIAAFAKKYEADYAYGKVARLTHNDIVAENPINRSSYFVQISLVKE